MGKTVEVPIIETLEKVVDVPVVKQVEVPQVQVIDKIMEIPFIQVVEKVVEVPEVAAPIAGGQRAVYNTLETLRQVAPAEVVSVVEVGPNFPTEQMAPVVKAAPIVETVVAAPVATYAAPTIVEQVIAAPAPVATYAAPTTVLP